MKVVKGMECLSCEERQRAGSVQLREERCQEDLINVCKYQKEDIKRIEPGSIQW